jgi:hypothetical protein
MDLPEDPIIDVQIRTENRTTFHDLVMGDQRLRATADIAPNGLRRYTFHGRESIFDELVSRAREMTDVMTIGSTILTVPVPFAPEDRNILQELFVADERLNTTPETLGDGSLQYTVEGPVSVFDELMMLAARTRATLMMDAATSSEEGQE